METKLKLPTWDDIKNLPRDNEFILVLFDFNSISVYGRITLFEDCTNRIHFDVHGYVTCEPQDEDFPIDHECNLLETEWNELVVMHNEMRI